ncbi:hypothetical protein GQ53DRAFT_743880 [Thozetella sp. PMI_491]|nr:hypothetical protein GQ53DRAFT_743880 [Thozetella sp. PMI_491]
MSDDPKLIVQTSSEEVGTGGGPDHPLAGSSTPPDGAAAPGPGTSRWRGIGPLLLLLALVNLAWSLYQLPLNRVVERSLCRDYYLRHDRSRLGPDGYPDERHCKVDEVQQGMGWIQGLMETTWIGGDCIMTIPLVCLAGRYGYRPLLWLNLVPRFVMLAWPLTVGYFDALLPLKAILVAPLSSVLGGDCVFNSIVYSLVAGMTDDPVTRATYFAQMSAVTAIFSLQLGPAIASATMSVLLWLPFLIGMVLLVIAVPLVTMLPARPGEHHESEGRASERRALLSAQHSDDPPSHGPLSESIAAQFLSLKTIVATHPRNFSLLLCSFFLTALASSDTKLLPQYISKRYGWRFVSIGYLLSVKAVFNFTLLTVVIPHLLRLASRRADARRQGESADTATLRRALLCLVLSILGALAIGLAPTIWLLVPSLFLYALGAALPIFTYSLLKSQDVSPDHHETAAGSIALSGQIFSIVMMVKTVGSLLGAPLMATLWVRGIAAGGAGLGIPYFMSAICYAAATAVARSIRVGMNRPSFPA